jgi:hypothetical protein
MDHGSTCAARDRFQNPRRFDAPGHLRAAAATATHCGISCSSGSKQLWRVKTQFSRDAR